MVTKDDQLPFGQRIGVFILAEISAISALSVTILLGYIAVCFQNPVGGRRPFTQVFDSIAQ